MALGVLTLVGIIDTNCSPDGIDYVIPGNDDSIRSIKLITGALADAILEGKQGQGGMQGQGQGGVAEEERHEMPKSLVSVAVADEAPDAGDKEAG